MSFRRVDLGAEYRSDLECTEVPGNFAMKAATRAKRLLVRRLLALQLHILTFEKSTRKQSHRSLCSTRVSRLPRARAEETMIKLMDHEGRR